MPRAAKSLNDTQLKAAKPKDKVYTLADGGGLYMRVMPNGSKTWIFQYTHPVTKKRPTIGFGVYPTVKLASARQYRDDANALLAKGIDPKELREQQAVEVEQQTSHKLCNVAASWLTLLQYSMASVF